MTQLIKINFATDKELESLPGIGRELAQRIVNHRKKEGYFHGTADLEKIPGVTPTLANNIVPYIDWRAPNLIQRFSKVFRYGAIASILSTIAAIIAIIQFIGPSLTPTPTSTKTPAQETHIIQPVTPALSASLTNTVSVVTQNTPKPAISNPAPNKTQVSMTSSTLTTTDTPVTQSDNSESITPQQQASDSTQIAYGSCTNVREISQTECEALLALYNSTAGDSWKFRWFESALPCKWRGITCRKHGDIWTVIELAISKDFGLDGTLPSDLWKLNNLEKLSIESYDLGGSIPSELSQLVNLKLLSFQNNIHDGPIPATIGNLTELRVLDFQGNALTGSIPPSFGNLVKLERLSLSGNQLIGPIPPELGRLITLKQLALSKNQLMGPLPDELANLSSLHSITLYENHLCIPNGSSRLYEWYAQIEVRSPAEHPSDC